MTNAVIHELRDASLLFLPLSSGRRRRARNEDTRA
jgi:hypothetical protein